MSENTTTTDEIEEEEPLDPSIQAKLLPEEPDNENPLRPVYAKLYNQILKLDAVMDLTLNPETAGRTKVRNTLVSEGKSDAEQMVKDIEEFLNQYEGRQLVAVFEAIVKNVADKYSKTADEFITAEVELQKANRPADADQLSVKEFRELLAKRTELYNNAQVMRTMALDYMGGTDTTLYPEIEARTGRNAPRTTSAWNRFAWTVDGNPITDQKKNNIRSIVEEYATLIPVQTVDVVKDGKTSQKTLTKLASFKLLMARYMGLPDGKFGPKLPANVHIKLENGPSISGVQLAEESESTDDDDDDDDDETDTAATTEEVV